MATVHLPVVQDPVPAPRFVRRRGTSWAPPRSAIGRAVLFSAGEVAPTPRTHRRPRAVADCEERAYGTPREPCPWVSCRHHLYLEPLRSGSLRLPFPDLEPDEAPWTCSLREADRGGLTLEQVGERTSLTRERVRQVEEKALAKVLKALLAAGFTADDLARYLDEAKG